MRTTTALDQKATANPLESIALHMLSISNEANLPQHYATDMSIDLEIINKIDKDFIWILRTHGTELITLNNGSNPAELTYWTKGESNNTIKVFHVTQKGRVIQPITHDQALDLVYQPPIQLSTAKGLQGLINSVNNVLNSRTWSMWGDELCIKNMESADHWHTYRDYFDHNKNIVMGDFMRKAITLKNNLLA